MCQHNQLTNNLIDEWVQQQEMPIGLLIFLIGPFPNRFLHWISSLFQVGIQPSIFFNRMPLFSNFAITQYNIIFRTTVKKKMLSFWKSLFWKQLHTLFKISDWSLNSSWGFHCKIDQITSLLWLANTSLQSSPCFDGFYQSFKDFFFIYIIILVKLN